ncbi:MAG: radical SAM family heme chaperone HemW [bacterium]|nr:radical SAM family heme chaperone HemW [bacterium]
MTLSNDMPLSLYLHIPFCTTKCSYCAFNTYTSLEHLIPAFVDALCREIALVGEANPHPYVHTIFFGGGTPSLLRPEDFDRILAQIRANFHLTPDAEISIEANPNDLNVPYLTALRAVGVNRLSIGMQSANPHELELFTRRHDVQAVKDAVEAARASGFDNLNLDLIYGIPNQTLDDWGRTLDFAIALQPEHLSLYALGLEPGTSMLAWVESGKLPEPDDDRAADMYDMATERLGSAGYEQYEISNWARPGRECRHNLQYWRNLPYLGLGPGAHGYAGDTRYSVMLSPQRYIKALSAQTLEKAVFPLTPAVAESTPVDQENEIAETLIMGLRLIREGIPRSAFVARFGVDVVDLHQKTLRRFADNDLLRIEPDVVRLTPRGRLLSNMIFRELV